MDTSALPFENFITDFADATDSMKLEPLVNHLSPTIFSCAYIGEASKSYEDAIKALENIYIMHASTRSGCFSHAKWPTRSILLMDSDSERRQSSIEKEAAILKPCASGATA